MKKLFLLIGVTFLVSCTTTGSVGVVHNPSVPVEQSALISANAGTITGYNGTAVNWTSPSWNRMIQIPAGNTILEWSIRGERINTGSDTVYRGKNILFAYNFRPQKKYFFQLALKDEKYGLNVYAYNFDEEIKISTRYDFFRSHFEAFAPFLNVNSAGDRTILE
jgi:hypothetical protein